MTPAMQDDDPGAALGALLVRAGIDPAGLDLPWLAKLKAETEAVIEAARGDPGFADAGPGWHLPARLPPPGGDDGAA
jgi:hypothetical protein